MTRFALRLAALATTTLLAGAASAQTQIGNVRESIIFPLVISQPGHYQLVAPLNVPAGVHGIKITAPNVVLDLNGYTIKGPGVCGSASCAAPGQSSGVWINSTNVTVRNGSIGGFDFAGVTFANTVVQLENLHVFENFQAGVYRHGQPMTTTLPARLTRVTAVRNGSQGILGHSMSVENCLLSQNFKIGLSSWGHTTIEGTLIERNRETGYVSMTTYNLYNVMRNSRIDANAVAAVGDLPTSLGGNSVAFAKY